MANSYKEAIEEAKSDLRSIINVIKEIEQEVAESSIRMSASMNKAFSGGNTPNEFNTQLKKQQEEISALNKKLEELATTTAKASDKKKEISDLTVKENTAIQKSIELNAKNQNALSGVTKEEIKREKALKKAFDRQTEFSRSYVQLIAKHKEAKKVLQDAIVSYGKLHPKTVQAQADFDRLTKKVNQANAATSNFSKNGLGSTLKSLRNLMGAFGIVGGAMMFAEFANSVIKTLKVLDKLDFSLKAIIKNEGELARTRGFLTDITVRYGAEIITTTERYTKFMIAARQSGLALKETEEIFGTVTKASAVLGLKTDELTGIYLALEQMLSKGKVTTEELRRQLGERLPGAFGIMADALGVTTIELDKMLRKGEILSDKALPKFAVALEDALGIEAVEKVETMQTATVRLSNAWTKFVGAMDESTSVGRAWQFILERLAKGIDNIANTMKGVEKVFEETRGAEYFKELQDGSNKTVEELEDDIKVLSGLIDLKQKEYEGLFALGLPKPFTTTEEIENAEAIIGTLKGRKKATEDYISLLKEKVKQDKLDRDALINKIVLKDKDISLLKLEAMTIQELRDLWAKLNDEKSNKEAERLAKQAAKDSYDLEVAKLKIAIDHQKSIIDNEELSFGKRMNAALEYSQLIEELLDAQTKYAIKEAGNRSDLILKIEAEESAQRLENYEDVEAKIVKIKTDALKDVEEALRNSQVENADAPSESFDKMIAEKNLIRRLEMEGDTAKKREEIIKAHNEKIAKIEEEWALKRLKVQIKIILDSLEVFKGSEEDRAKLEQKLYDLSVKLSKEEANQSISESERKDQKEEELHKKKLDRLAVLKDVFNTVMNTFADAYDLDLAKFDFLFDDKKNTVGEWADAAVELIGTVLDASLEKYDIELQTAQRVRDLTLNNELATEEEKEAARRQYEEKERKIKTKRAKEERNNTLIKIAIDTAAAVVKVLAQTGVLAPFVIPSIVGLGLAQAAFVASQPLPKFYKGTENAPEGPAIVDEYGPEVHTDKNDNVKHWGSHKGANIRYLSKGDKIYKSRDKFFESQNIDDINKAVWQLNLQSNGEAISTPEIDKALINSMEGMRTDMDKMGKRIERLATRPINNTVKVELEDKRAY